MEHWLRINTKVMSTLCLITSENAKNFYDSLKALVFLELELFLVTFPTCGIILSQFHFTCYINLDLIPTPLRLIASRFLLTFEDSFRAFCMSCRKRFADSRTSAMT